MSKKRRRRKRSDDIKPWQALDLSSCNLFSKELIAYRHVVIISWSLLNAPLISSDLHVIKTSAIITVTVSWMKRLISNWHWHKLLVNKSTSLSFWLSEDYERISPYTHGKGLDFKFFFFFLKHETNSFKSGLVRWIDPRFY